MSIDEKEEQMLLQMNELFDELIEDAFDFSQDIMLGINLMPFATGFILLFTVGYVWLMFFWFKDVNLVSILLNVGIIGCLLYLCYALTRKYFELKNKYSTLFEIKKELDELKEL